ncbi:MAG: hypothetical protein AAGA30_05025, partial [Planctomycetota bacterium]
QFRHTRVFCDGCSHAKRLTTETVIYLIPDCRQVKLCETGHLNSGFSTVGRTFDSDSVLHPTATHLLWGLLL